MFEFLRRNRVLLTCALLALIGVGLVLRTGPNPAPPPNLSGFFLEIMRPLQRAAVSVGRTVMHPFQVLGELYRARDEVIGLRARLEELTTVAEGAEEIRLENERLRQLLDFRQALRGDLLTARIIGRDATGLARTLLVDRGESDGVKKGAAALAPGGIVGQVFLTSAHAARVLLISDHNSGVDAIVQRTRARGIVEGSIDGICGIKFVKRTEDIREGDLVITEGLDGIFPKGLPIGVVQSVDKRTQGLFQYAEITPRVDFAQLEEVLLTRGQMEVLAPVGGQ